MNWMSVVMGEPHWHSTFDMSGKNRYPGFCPLEEVVRRISRSELHFSVIQGGTVVGLKGSNADNVSGTKKYLSSSLNSSTYSRMSSLSPDDNAET